MITVNVLQRTFHLSFGPTGGTGFCLDAGGRQYLVTARHVVPGIKNGSEISIYWKSSWHAIPVRVVGIGAADVDVAVLALDQLIARPDLPLPGTMDKIVFGQDVYFLGYPFGLHTEMGPLNSELPVPLIKKATLSGMVEPRPGSKALLLDGINNPGFSGGPVVFTLPNQNSYSVAGVISGYRQNTAPVWKGDDETEYTVRENTGIVLAYSVEHVTELIEANPIGCELPNRK